VQLTEAMRRYAKSHLGVAEGASDEQIKQALGAALFEGRVDSATWAGLQKNQAPDGRAVIEGIIDGRLKSFEDRIAALLGGQAGQAATGTAGAAVTAVAGTGTTGTAGGQGGGTAVLSPDQESFVNNRIKTILEGMGFKDGQPPPVPSGGRVGPHELLVKMAAAGGDGARLKSPLERYSQTVSEARWPSDHKHYPLRGMRMTYPGEEGPGRGRPLDIPSQAHKALLGAYVKWCSNVSWFGGEMPQKYRLNDHDKELIAYMVHELPWSGYVGGDVETGTPVAGEKLANVFHRGLDGVKAVLDDSVSGGINAAPVVIEDQLIITPLLYGELFPLVTVINLARGRRIHGATMGRPTFTSGIPEGTPIPLFDTTNFLGTFDASIFTAVGAMEIGLDFEEDSPSNIGATVTGLYGEAALAWLDRVIALGDGVSEPLGIFNTAGLTAVASANGAVGPLTVADAEGLMFGLNKAYRTARGGSNVFIGNDTAYRRFRSIPLGSTWANSRAFGPDYQNYTVLNLPFKIIPLVPNNWVSFANIAFYRMWRRLGMTIRVETAGRTLALNNTKMIIVRMRYGGLPEQGGAFAVLTDAPQ
jgi:HK97 family phage major capsid protein